MNWTLCSERLPELKPVSDSVMSGGTIKNPDAWEGLVWFEGFDMPYVAKRTNYYFKFNVDGFSGWYDIGQYDFDRVKWADFPANPFDEK